MRFGLKSLGVIVAMIAVSIVVVKWGYLQLNGQSGASQTASTANHVFSSRVVLPASASDVNFYTDLCWIEADFAISEQAFLSWCEQHGWSQNPIDAKVGAVFIPARTSPIAEQGRSRIFKGYEYQTSSGTGVYDVDRGRACISHYDC